MNKNLVEIVAIIDESGSMASLKNDIIGGFNNFVDQQKKIAGEARLSLVTFSDHVRTVLEGTPLQNVNLLNDSSYNPGGMTALLDAVGTTVDKVGQRLALLPENARPGKVVVLIMTDGQENSSREFKREQIAEKVKHQQSKYSWEFVFLGANQDSFAEASTLGILRSHTYNYASTAKGLGEAYSTLNMVTARARGGAVDNGAVADLNGTVIASNT